MPSKRIRWTNNDILILIDCYRNNMDEIDTSKLLKRSTGSIISKIYELRRRSRKFEIKITKIALLPFELKEIICRYLLLSTTIGSYPNIYALSAKSQINTIISDHNNISKMLFNNYVSYMEILYSTDTAAVTVKNKIINRYSDIIFTEGIHIVYVGKFHMPGGTYVCCAGSIAYFIGYCVEFEMTYQKSINIRDLLKYERLIRNKFGEWRKKEDSQNYGQVPIDNIVKYIKSIN